MEASIYQDLRLVISSNIPPMRIITIVVFAAAISGAKALSVTIVLNNAPLCNYENGSISAAASGGVPPYSYQWSNGSTEPWITVMPGVYSITITDFEGSVA